MVRFRECVRNYVYNNIYLHMPSLYVYIYNFLLYLCNQFYDIQKQIIYLSWSFNNP